MSHALKCLTPLKQYEDKDIYDVYDRATELTFKLDHAVNERAFLAIHLNDEASYLYRDDIEIRGDSFQLVTDKNFLDAMKDFAGSGQKYIKLSVELELNEGTLQLEEALINPWF